MESQAVDVRCYGLGCSQVLPTILRYSLCSYRLDQGIKLVLEECIWRGCQESVSFDLFSGTMVEFTCLAISRVRLFATLLPDSSAGG